MGFTVAAIVNESGPVIDRFLRWYLAQGASAVWLFFDDPASPNMDRLASAAGVTVTPCTPEFWHGLGLSPDVRFTRRQNAALTWAYGQVQDGWLLNVDADELMYFPGTTLAARLETVAAEDRTIRVASAELVGADVPEQMFRIQVPRERIGAVYADAADLFRRRFGLIGHADGKSFHRAGQPGIRLRQHWAEDAGGNEVPGLRWGAAEGAYLLHYLAPDYELWRAKLEWRLGSHGFPEPIKERLRAIQASEPDPEAAYRRLYDLLHRLTPAQIAQLREIGGLLELPASFAGEMT
jgi:hypothetical protein